jgi:hypothetical protein
VKSARCHRAIDAKRRSYVTSATRPSATNAKSSTVVMCARRITVVSVRILSGVISVRRHSVKRAKIPPSVKHAVRYFVWSAKILAIAKNARCSSAAIAKTSPTAVCASRHSVVSVQRQVYCGLNVSAVKSAKRHRVSSARSVTFPNDFDLQVVASTKTSRVHRLGRQRRTAGRDLP